MNAYEELITAIARFVRKNGNQTPDGILVNDHFDCELCDVAELRSWTFAPGSSSRDKFAGIPYAVVPKQSVRWRFVVGDQE